MQKQAKKVIVLIVGVFFILLGLVGLFTPFLQGILFLIIGFLILSVYFPVIHTHLHKHSEKSPKFFSMVNKAEAWIKRFIGEI